MTKEYCTECGKELKPEKIVLLDMNMSSCEFREEPWPDNISQGSFPFGKACAKTVLKNKGQLIKGPY